MGLSRPARAGVCRASRRLTLVLLLPLPLAGGRVLASSPTPTAMGQAAQTAPSPIGPRLAGTLARLPLYLVENRGRLDRRIAYYVEGRDTAVYFTSRGLVFAFADPTDRPASAPARVQPVALHAEPGGELDGRRRWLLELEFVGAPRASSPRATAGRTPS